MSTFRSDQTHELFPSALGLLTLPAATLGLTIVGVVSGGISVFLAVRALSGVAIAFIGTVLERLMLHCHTRNP